MFRVFHRGLVSTSGLVTGVRSEDRGHAVNWSVLDPHLRDSRGARFRGVSGQCAAHEEPAGTQERCAGESVVAEIAHLWAVEQLVPTAGGDSRPSYLLAATGRARAGGGDVHSTYAEGLDADECANGKCNQRCEWSDPTSHHTGHGGRRTRSAEVSGT